MITDFDTKENREFFNKKFWYKTGGIIFIMVVLLLAIVDFRIYKKRQELLSQIATYQKQIEDLKESSGNLKEEIANSDNADYLEKLAYEQLGEQKPGEEQVIFIMPEEKAETSVEKQNFWNTFSGWLNGAWQWIIK